MFWNFLQHPMERVYQHPPPKTAPYPPRWEWPPAVAPAIARTPYRAHAPKRTPPGPCATMHGAAPAASRPRESARRYSDNPARECCASPKSGPTPPPPAVRPPASRRESPHSAPHPVSNGRGATGTRPYPPARTPAPCGSKNHAPAPPAAIKSGRRESEYTRSVRGEPLPDGALATKASDSEKASVSEDEPPADNSTTSTATSPRIPRTSESNCTPGPDRANDETTNKIRFKPSFSVRITKPIYIHAPPPEPTKKKPPDRNHYFKKKHPKQRRRPKCATTHQPRQNLNHKLLRTHHPSNVRAVSSEN